MSLCFRFLLPHIVIVSDSTGLDCFATPLTYLFWLMLSDFLLLYHGCFYSFLLRLFVLNVWPKLHNASVFNTSLF